MDVINFTDEELDKLKERYYTTDCYESTTHPYLFDDKPKVIKIFKPHINVENKVKKIKLIKERTEGLNFITKADFLVSNNDKIIGYGMPYIYGKPFNYSTDVKPEKIIPILKDLKIKLNILHELDIAYIDFAHNFIVKFNGNVVLIDSDNVMIDDYDVDIYDNIAKAYMKKGGKLNKKYDDYMLNLLTIGALAHCGAYGAFELGPCNFKRWPKDEEIKQIVYNTLDFSQEISITENKSTEYNEKLIVDLINDKKDYKKIRSMGKRNFFL